MPCVISTASSFNAATQRDRLEKATHIGAWLWSRPYYNNG